ncbi:MAG: hypothetical protein IKI81_06025, partial [Selenomonadaceae bacterium]|nr:hypothetical protein [Selenomonadaceae bacterium]
ADLSKSGVYRYAEATDFKVLLFGYSADGGPVEVIDIEHGDNIPEGILHALTDPAVVKWAFNASFERVCLSRMLGLPPGTYLDPAQWRCAMVWAATLGLPQSLEGAGAVLGLTRQKLSEGRNLIRRFCIPGKAMAHQDDPQWLQFVEYNRRDVEAEMGIMGRLAKFPVPDAVWEQYRLDQEINDRGVLVDMELVKQALVLDGMSRSRLTAAMKNLTAMDNPNSVLQMKQWLSKHGVEAETLGKRAVAELLQTAPEELREPLRLRLQLAKSSVKKYAAMDNAVCSDGHARGMFRFYGASRTGRWSGKIIQMQNLRRNDLPDLGDARDLVRRGDYDAVDILYGDVPDVLSQLVRTAFVAPHGKKFIVADFSAIEARVLAWLAGEEWRMDLFKSGGDIYCQSASKMFKVPVVKHGVNGHLRQKGKVAELACIAEGQLVLTSRGLVPIESITKDDELWDGESWVKHDGVVFKGEREVIEYEGLTATPDHLVWVEGQREPVLFGYAAASGSHLIQTEYCGQAIRMGQDHFAGKTLEQQNESLLCPDGMHWMRRRPLDFAERSDIGTLKRLPGMFPAEANPKMARKASYRGKATMHKSSDSGLQKLRRTRDQVRISIRARSWLIPAGNLRLAAAEDGNRPHRHERRLCPRKHPLCIPSGKLRESEAQRPFRIQPEVLAIRTISSDEDAVARLVQRGNHRKGTHSRGAKKEELAAHRRTSRLYDIRNAGPHHRFTVSGRLVHNCGYGGSVGALKAMGAIEMGLSEDELPGLVSSWRDANPSIVRFWWRVDEAAKNAVRNRISSSVNGIGFECRSGMLFIALPSGRRLAYPRPRLGENRFGGESITFEGAGMSKKWERIETYGPKLTENIVQALSRDILASAMQNLRGHRIVMHIHDEVVIESELEVSLEGICGLMSRTPPWAEGLLLRADGYETLFYRKD